MQGQKSSVQSLPELSEFDLVSASDNAGIDQQIYWNSFMSPVAARNVQECLPSSGDTSYANSVGSASGGFTGRNPMGVSSCGHLLNQDVNDETKIDQGWMSSITHQARPIVSIEERQLEPINTLSLGSVDIDLNGEQMANGQFLKNSSSDNSPQSAHVSLEYIENGGHMDSGASHLYKPTGSESTQVPFSSAIPCASDSTTPEHLAEDSDGRFGCPLDSRRLSCKRKALEGAPGTSLGGSNSGFQQAESSMWHALPNQQNTAGISVSSTLGHLPGISSQEELFNTRLNGMRGSPDCFPPSARDGSAECSRRNFRMRINSAHPEASAQPNIWSPATNRHPQVFSSQHSSSRFLLFNQPLDPRLTATNPTPHYSPVASVSGFSRNSIPWNSSSNSRVGSSSNSPLISGENTAVLRGEASSRNAHRSISEYTMLFPSIETRPLTQDSLNWGLVSGGVSIPGSATLPGNTSSQISSSLEAHLSPSPTWALPQNPPRYSRRLSEAVRRSLCSIGSDPGASSSHFHPRTAAASSQDVLPSGSSYQGHHPSYPRPAYWMDRQVDGVIGIPLSLRALASASEGRSRLASELRSMLELVRRSESLRAEDVLIVDPSVIFGASNLHDRHRDMRLDVDSMSYEELLALEERIGNVSTGLGEETILKSLKQSKYAVNEIAVASKVEPCCICQEEYEEGEHIGTLDCGHDFHTICIKQWLMQKNLCPVCKTEALVT